MCSASGEVKVEDDDRSNIKYQISNMERRTRNGIGDEFVGKETSRGLGSVFRDSKLSHIWAAAACCLLGKKEQKLVKYDECFALAGC